MIKQIISIFIGVGVLLLGSPSFLDDAVIWAAEPLAYSSANLASVDSATAKFFCTDVSEIPTAECEALIALYESTDGHQWSDNTGWLTTNTPCSWFGVTCVGGHVTELELGSNQLNGTIPSELGNLTNLIYLKLSSNQLSGTIPSELGNLVNLTKLLLYSNELSGTIPSELDNLTNLTEIRLNNNQLSGTIPSELGNLTHLTFLALSTNQLSSTIPSEICQATQLDKLYIQANDGLTGPLPSCLTDLSPSILKFNGTDICEPPTQAFQGWLDLIANLDRTNVLCEESTLDLSIAASTQTAHPGDTITYNLIISATGESVTAALTNTLPSELSDIQNISGATYDAANHRIHYQGVITPGMPYTIEYTSKLAQDVISGTVVLNTALLSSTDILLERSAAINVLETSFCTNVSEIPTAECEALVALYESTDGDSWINNTGWLTTNTPCSWFGVTCVDGHVTELTLDENQLSGAIPSELGNLANLTVLNLGRNQLSGTIPFELGNLTSLITLYLKSNQLSGTIPSELGNLTNLESLDLYSNQLGGTIPSELGNLTNLKTLSLWTNHLSGTIPSELGNLTNLKTLFLHVNGLSGTIPSELGNLANLKTLNLNVNRLTGAIPSELGNLANLKTLHLNNNRLTGTIPSELSNLTGLWSLRLYNTQLSGNIPPELGNLTNLTELYLYSTQLSGTIPSEICQATQLDRLYIQANDGLTGPLPSCLVDLSPISLKFNSTDICEPPTEAFQGWLDSIADVRSTNVLCEESTLDLSIAASTQTVHPGDSITYNLIISATGESAAVTLTNTLPSELSDIQNISGATYDAANHRIHYQGGITPGVAYTIAYTAKLAQDLTPGTVVLNTALLSGMGLVRERSATVAVESDESQALVLVYGIGDNDLSSWMLDAINNAEVAASNPAIKIRYLLDGPGSDDTYIFNLEADQNPSCPNYNNQTCGGRYVLGKNLWKWTDNTASPHSLAEFISSSIDAYPNAAAVYVVLAGHGNGWAPNVLPHQPRGWDGQPDPLGGLLTDDHPHGFLSTKAFGAGLEWAYESTGRKIDLLYLDACSMGQLEVAYEIRETVGYLLASESTSWTTFSYDQMFSAINMPPQTASEVGQSWLSAESALLNAEGYPFTLSLTDLNQVSTVLEAQNELADQLLNDLPSRRAKIMEAMRETDCFDSDYNGSHSSSKDNYCDLHSFAKKIAAQFKDETAIVEAAQSVIDTLKDTVVSQKYAGGVPWIYPGQQWDWDELGGLTTYAPFQEDEWKRKYYTKNHLSSARDGRWDELIHEFWREGGEVDDPDICTIDDCDGLGPPLSVHPVLQTPEYVTVTRDSTVSLPIDLASNSHHLVNAQLDVNFDNSCLSVADVQFNLPAGFTGEYNVVGGNTIKISVNSAATPKPALLDDTIATLEFTATCSASVTVTNALFEDIDQKSLSGLTNNTQINVVADESAEIILECNYNSDDVIVTGDWLSSTQVKPFYGPDYCHDDNKRKGEKSVQFLPEITSSCNYQVDMHWTAASGRATNVPVDIEHSAGTDTVYVNQQHNGSQWNSLGIYALSTGSKVAVRTDNTDGHVIVDAMRFTPILPCGEPIPSISIQPQPDSVILSSTTTDTITVDFVIENIAEAIFAGQIVVEYDNTILEAIDFDDTKPGPQLEHGDFLPTEKVIRNVIDQANGRIEYAISRQGEVPGVDGSGLFARAHFRAIGAGVSPLTFAYTAFNTRLPKPIAVSQQNSQIEVIANTVSPTLSVSGIVTDIHAEENHAGIDVCLNDDCIQTAADGSYSFTNVPISGTITYAKVYYLKATVIYAGEPGTHIDIPDIEMRGGDVNKNGKVDDVDATIIGNHWGSTSDDSHWKPRADLYRDNFINVTDMSFVQLNWRHESETFYVGTAASRRSQPGVRASARRMQKSQASSQNSAKLWTELVPSRAGEEITANIRVKEAVGMYSFNVVLNFDSAILKVQSKDDIRAGEFLDPINHFVVVNDFDNDKGRVELMVTQLHPAVGRSGDGLLGAVIFERIADGDGNIRITERSLLDDSTPDPLVIPASIIPIKTYLPLIFIE